ncbi:hypothetical protein BDW74DRAFT_145137 [Aspergillus multicolor]|uniref:uncharacterized protein n=1 Tax=Aspergillus multicolor TaxID=41759 RepID=UPI003CCD67E7
MTGFRLAGPAGIGRFQLGIWRRLAHLACFGCFLLCCYAWIEVSFISLLRLSHWFAIVGAYFFCAKEF